MEAADKLLLQQKRWTLGGASYSMNDPLEGRLADAVRRALELLTSRDYDGLAAWTKGDRLTSAEIRTAIESYGRTVVSPAANFWQSVEVYPIEGQEPKSFAVDCPLWTTEEGRSDLTLQVTLRDGPAGVAVTLDDIHVL